MSEELYEVAFSGVILEGADIEQVKVRVGAMFKADAAKLAHLFSGKRVVIKKDIDQATANKYKSALTNAGAACEVKSLSEAASPTAVPAARAEERPAVKEAPRAPRVFNGDIPAAPKTDPLGITADDIAELDISVAPPGSDMQSEIKEVAAPEFDISGLDMAAPGSDLGEIKKADAPPPPDTTGLKIVD
jgi:hypothetical protein